MSTGCDEMVRVHVQPYEEPWDYLEALVEEGKYWHIDYTFAGPCETNIWASADCSWRILRALRRGLTVIFDEMSYKARYMNEVDLLEDRLRGHIHGLKCSVFIISDNEHGVLVGIATYHGVVH
ncbi:MAG: hypothetical protein Q8P93_00400 [bacterium]|nr:hypothetical protein [bacterium]